MRFHNDVIINFGATSGYIPGSLIAACGEGEESQRNLNQKVPKYVAIATCMTEIVAPNKIQSLK
jgi:hypothetical protein